MEDYANNAIQDLRQFLELFSLQATSVHGQRKGECKMRIFMGADVEPGGRNVRQTHVE